MDSVLEKFLIENLIFCPVLATLFLGHTWFLSQRNFQEYDLYSMYCFTCLQFLCCSFWLFPLQFLNSSWFISYCNVDNNMILNGYIICITLMFCVKLMFQFGYVMRSTLWYHLNNLSLQLYSSTVFFHVFLNFTL